MKTLRFLLDRPPASTNPRSTLDAIGQRLNSLLYSGLTRVTANLDPVPDLAESWETRNSGREIRFKVREGLHDHAGAAITPSDLRECLEQYRAGRPLSPYRSSFPHWVATRNTDREVILELSQPDPYILRNISLLHFFRATSNAVPCSEPLEGEPLVGSGPYRMKEWNPLPETDVTFLPLDPRRYLPVHFQFVVDDTTRLLKILRGDVDITIDSISLTKERWLEKNHGDLFKLISRRSSRVSYLGMNEKVPILANAEVRKAISLAIDREQVVRDKMLGLASVAGSLLSPEVRESVELKYPFDPSKAEKLLDKAGFPRKGPKGIRFALHYKTTPVRDGLETALIIREMLQRIGIQVDLDLVEPAVFLQSIRKGNFELMSSRWLGISDASILYRILDSKSVDNRVAYRDTKVDQLLEETMTELNPEKRSALTRKIQETLARDIPYLPLWFWYVGVVVRKDHPVVSKIRPEDLSVTGALEPLLQIR